MGRDAVFGFFIRQEDPANELEWTDSGCRPGDGNYELAIDHQSDPDLGLLTI
jgi:hypothetical protein